MSDNIWANNQMMALGSHSKQRAGVAENHKATKKTCTWHQNETRKYALIMNVHYVI